MSKFLVSMKNVAFSLWRGGDTGEGAGMLECIGQAPDALWKIGGAWFGKILRGDMKGETELANS